MEIEGTSPGQKPSCEIVEDLQLGVSTAFFFLPSCTNSGVKLMTDRTHVGWFGFHALERKVDPVTVTWRDGKSTTWMVFLFKAPSSHPDFPAMFDDEDTPPNHWIDIGT